MNGRQTGLREVISVAQILRGISRNCCIWQMKRYMMQRSTKRDFSGSMEEKRKTKVNEKQDLSYIMIEDKTIPVVLERKVSLTLSIGIQVDGSLMI